MRRRDESNDVVKNMRSPGSAATPIGFEGKVTGIEEGAIVGWAWNPDLPYDPVDIEAYVDDLRVGDGCADGFDLALARANRGNGLHRFELRLDRLPDKPPPFNVRIVVANSDVELQPPVAVTSLDQAEYLLKGSEYTGRISGIFNGMVCGWVVNKRNPHEQPVVTLRDGTKELATVHAIQRESATTESGTTSDVYRFELPLPASILDGQSHTLAIAVSDSPRQLVGSPISFGPADANSLTSSLVSTLEKVDRLERRIAGLQPAGELQDSEKRIAGKLAERIDLLLNIHRDSIDRELAILRRQISEIVKYVPELETDLIAPGNTGAIEDILPIAPVEFSAIKRSVPIAEFDLTERPKNAVPTGGLHWSSPGTPAAVMIAGSGAIELDGITSGEISVALAGSGAVDPREFGGVVVGFCGCPMSGRFDVAAGGKWAFVGTTIGIPSSSAPVCRLTIEYLSGFSSSSGRLSLSTVSVFGRDRAPVNPAGLAAAAVIVNLGESRSGSGWYSAEAGSRGGLCWMGANSEIRIELTGANAYRVAIPEVRPLSAEILTRLAVYLDNEPVALKISAVAGNPSVFNVEGHCKMPTDESGTRSFRISFPDEAVKSPMELGLNSDMRLLSIAARCIMLTPAEN